MTQQTSNLPEHAEGAIRDRVRREMKDTIGYELPLLDAYIALASSTLVVTSQLASTGVTATPKDTFPIAVDEVHRQRARRLSQYFQEESPENRFYLLCLAKGYQQIIPLDPPWVDEAKVIAAAAGVADPAKAGLIKRNKGKTTLVANPELDDRWANQKTALPKTDFTPNRLEGTPVFEMPQKAEKPFQQPLL